jgi:hypothetical protein
MRLLSAAAWAAATMSAAPLIAAQPVSAPLAESASRLERATALVEILNPYEAMVDVNMRGWEAGVAHAEKVNPSLAKLEAEYPGIMKAGIDAARPLARQQVGIIVTKGGEFKAAAIAERLTATEIDEATAFFGSPAGMRLVQGLVGNADPSAMARKLADQAAETGTVEVTAEAVARDLHVVTNKTMGQLSAADHLELMRFGLTPTARKLNEAVAESERKVMVLINNPDPEWLKNQDEIMTEAMLAFVESKAKQ